MIDMRGRRGVRRIGPQMLNAVKVVETFHHGKAPSKLSVYRNMRTSSGTWSNRFLSSVVDRAIGAGLLKASKEKGGRYSVEITDKGKEALDKWYQR